MINYQQAQLKAEEFTNCVCIALDYDYNVKAITCLMSKDIIAGVGAINDLESALVHAYMHDEGVEDAEQNLATAIKDCVIDYILECEEDLKHGIL